MTEEKINSTYLNEMMILKIYKPESFSPLYKYNLCIMQDGDDYYQIGRIATLSDMLHTNHEIENTILIGINYQDKYDRRDKYHPNGDQQRAYMMFLAHEVVPFLDDTLPTLHMAHSRTLIGDSLAGTLGLMTALTYPHTFGKVIMQSPFVNEKVMDLVTDAKDIHLIDIYHTIGTNEINVPTTSDGLVDFITPNRKLNELLQIKGVSHQYHELNEGEHTWKYWQQDLPHALKFMFS